MMAYVDVDGCIRTEDDQMKFYILDSSSVGSTCWIVYTNTDFTGALDDTDYEVIGAYTSRAIADPVYDLVVRQMCGRLADVRTVKATFRHVGKRMVHLGDMAEQSTRVSWWPGCGVYMRPPRKGEKPQKARDIHEPIVSGADGPINLYESCVDTESLAKEIAKRIRADSRTYIVLAKDIKDARKFMSKQIPEHYAEMLREIVPTYSGPVRFGKKM